MQTLEADRVPGDANVRPHDDMARHLALVAFSTLCAALWVARLKWAGPFMVFLWWNLFLAWVPWVLAVALRRVRGPAFAIVFCAWLGFFPNAPYLVTDLVHLKPRLGVPLWFDVLLFASFAWAGCALGWDSLWKVQRELAHRFGRRLAALAVTACVGLCGVGVFLGRFERLNSWELVTDPLDVLRTSLDALLDVRALAYSGAFALFVGAGYLFTRPRDVVSSPRDSQLDPRRDGR
ncbi:MAG: DUF1361 domain-containing protein [Myxococcaceae bacterium]